MPARTLSIQNLGASPFSGYVRKRIERGLEELVRSKDLVIDFTGTKKSNYNLVFESKYSWNRFNRDRCWYHPGVLGVTGTLNVEAIRRRNYCENVGKCSTCEPIYKNTQDQLGKAISHTALHEIGHVFGLVDKSSYSGADDGGHTGDPRNLMFVELLHKDYVRRSEDYERTRKYPIVKGETLSGIAKRIGFRPPPALGKKLYDFRGKDGKRNRDLLKSKDPNLIFPGEEIWIPDVKSRLLFMRRIELEDKTFTKAQFDTMRRWLRAGKTLFSVH